MKTYYFMTTGFAVLGLTWMLAGSPVYAGDLDDGISKYTDESISADDQALKTDKNINFIVLEAISRSQTKGKQGDQNTNFNDGSGDDNENSIVVGPGTQTGDIINVVIEK